MSTPLLFSATLLTFPDFRRYLRPLFMEPDGQRPGPYKGYYDFATYLVTQSMFCFTTAPFVILTLTDSLKVWSRVYFYAILAVAASTGFFASPAKVWLIRRQKTRARPGGATVATHASATEDNAPVLGLPNDPKGEVDEAMQEIQGEVQARRRTGTATAMSAGKDLRTAVEQTLGQKT